MRDFEDTINYTTNVYCAWCGCDAGLEDPYDCLRDGWIEDEPGCFVCPECMEEDEESYGKYNHFAYKYYRPGLLDRRVYEDEEII